MEPAGAQGVRDGEQPDVTGDVWGDAEVLRFPAAHGCVTIFNDFT